MSNQPRQQFRLHERHRQWELRLHDDCAVHGDFLLERGFQAASRLVFSAFSSAMQTAGEQLESYAQAHDAGPSPDVWRTLGARDRMLTPRLYGLHLVQRVEAAMLAGGDMFVNNALIIKGLANVGPNSNLIFVFVPMTSLFTQPDIAYTMTDLTSRVFVPADLEGISEIEATTKKSLKGKEEVEEEEMKDEDEEQIKEEEEEEKEPKEENPEEEEIKEKPEEEEIKEKPEEEEKEKEEEEERKDESEEEPKEEEPKEEEPKEEEPKEEEPKEEPKEESAEEESAEEPEEEEKEGQEDEEEQRRLREEEEMRLREEERRRGEAEEAERRLREEGRKREAEEAEMRLREEEERRRREEEERRRREEEERIRMEAQEEEMRRLQMEEVRQVIEEEFKPVKEKRDSQIQTDQRSFTERLSIRYSTSRKFSRERRNSSSPRELFDATSPSRRASSQVTSPRRKSSDRSALSLADSYRKKSNLQSGVEPRRISQASSQVLSPRRKSTDRSGPSSADSSSKKSDQQPGVEARRISQASSQVSSPRKKSTDKSGPSSADSSSKKSDPQQANGARGTSQALSQVPSNLKKSADKSAHSSANSDLKKLDPRPTVGARPVSPTNATLLSPEQHTSERSPSSRKPVESLFVFTREKSTAKVISRKQPAIKPSVSPKRPTQDVHVSVSPKRPTPAVPVSSMQVTDYVSVSSIQPTPAGCVSSIQTTLVPSFTSRLSSPAAPNSLLQPTPEASDAPRLSTPAAPASLRQPTPEASFTSRLSTPAAPASLQQPTPEASFTSRLSTPAAPASLRQPTPEASFTSRLSTPAASASLRHRTPEASATSRQPTPETLPPRQTMETFELTLQPTSEESISPRLVTPEGARGFSPSPPSSGMSSCVGSPKSKIREDLISMSSMITKEKSTILEKFDIKYVREEISRDTEASTSSAAQKPSIRHSTERSSRSHSVGPHHCGCNRSSRVENGTQSASIERKHHSASRSVIPALSPSSNRTTPSFRESRNSNKSHSRSPSICSQGEGNVIPQIFFSKESQLSTSRVTGDSETDRSNSRSQSPLSLGEGKALLSFSAASQVKNWTLDSGLCRGSFSKSPSPVISPSRKTARQNCKIAGLSGKSESASLPASPFLASPFREKTNVSRAGSPEGDSVDPEIGSSVDGPSPKLKTQISLVEKIDKDFSESPYLSKTDQHECSEVSENTDDDVTLETVSSEYSEDDDWNNVDNFFKANTDNAIPTTQRHSSPIISQMSASAVKCELEKSNTILFDVKEVAEVQPALITAEKVVMGALGSFAASTSRDGHELVSRQEDEISTAVSPMQHCVEGTTSVTPFETSMTLSPIQMKTENKHFETKMPVKEERTSPLVFNVETAMEWTGQTKVVPAPLRTTSPKADAAVLSTEEIPLSSSFIKEAKYAQTPDKIKTKRIASPPQFTTKASNIPWQPIAKAKVQHRRTAQEPTASSKKSVSLRNHSPKSTAVSRQNSPESAFSMQTYSLEPSVLSRKHSPNQGVLSRNNSPETGVLYRKHSPEPCASSKKNLEEAVALSRKHSPELSVYSKTNSPELSVSSRKHSPKAAISPMKYSPESVASSWTHSPKSAALSQKYSTASDVSSKKHSQEKDVLTRTQDVLSKKYLQDSAALLRKHSPESDFLSRNNSPDSSVSSRKHSSKASIPQRKYSPESFTSSRTQSPESAVSSRNYSPELRFLLRKHSPKPDVLSRKHSPQPDLSSNEDLQYAGALSRKHSPELNVLSKNNSPVSISSRKHSPKPVISQRKYSPESFTSSRTHSPEFAALSRKYSMESAVSLGKHSPESTLLPSKLPKSPSIRKPTLDKSISPKRITPTSIFSKQSTPVLTLSSQNSSPERTISRESTPEILFSNSKSTLEPSFLSKTSSPARTISSRRSTPVPFASSELSLGSKSHSPRQLTPEHIISIRKTSPEPVALSRRTTPESTASPRKHSPESLITSRTLTPKSTVSPKRTKLTASVSPRHPTPQQTGSSRQPTPEKNVNLSPKFVEVDKQMYEMEQDNLTNVNTTSSSSVQDAFAGISSHVLEYFRNEYFNKNKPEFLKPLSSEVSTKIEPYLDTEELVHETSEPIDMTQMEERTEESKSDVQGKEEEEHLHKTAFYGTKAFSVSPDERSLAPSPSSPFGAFESRLRENSFKLPFENVNATPLGSTDASPKKGSPMPSPASPISASSQRIQERITRRSSPSSFQGHAPRTSAGSLRRNQKSSTPQLSRTRQAGPFTLDDDVYSRYSSRKSASGQTQKAHQTSPPKAAILIKRASPPSSIPSPPTNNTSFTTLLTSPILSPSKEGQIPLHPSRSYIQRLQKALATAGSDSQEDRAAKPASTVQSLQLDTLRDTDFGDSRSSSKFPKHYTADKTGLPSPVAQFSKPTSGHSTGLHLPARTIETSPRPDRAALSAVPRVVTISPKIKKTLATKAETVSETYDSTSSVQRAGSSKDSPRKALPASLHAERTQKVTPSKNKMALAQLLAAQRKNAKTKAASNESTEEDRGRMQAPGSTPREMTRTKSRSRNARTKRTVSEGLKNLLAAQRKSVYKKRQGGSVERPRETKAQKDRFQNRANQSLPHEQEMTSVKEELVKHDRLPPTSTVTITRKTVTYTAEPVLPTSEYASPPRILSWPVAVPTSLPQPIPIPSRESVETEPEKTFSKASSEPTNPLRFRLFSEPSSKTSPTLVEQKHIIQDSHRTSTIPSAFSSFRAFTAGSTSVGETRHPVQDSRAVTKSRNKSALSHQLSPSVGREIIGTHRDNHLDQISQINTTSESTHRSSDVQRSFEHNKGAEELKDSIPMDGRESGRSFISRNTKEDSSNVFSVFTNKSQGRPISPKTSSKLRNSPKSPLRRRMVDIVERQRLLEERRKRNKSLGCSFDSPEMTTPSENKSPIEMSPADHPRNIVGIPSKPISRKASGRRSPGTSPGRKGNYPNSAAIRGLSKKSSPGDYPGNILAYPEFLAAPLPLNQQLQSYRHTQGLVGDSSENIFFSKLRASSFQRSMEHIPDLGQQKQMKHAACNEDNSELRGMLQYRSKYPNDGASIFEHHKEAQNVNINRTLTGISQHDNWTVDTNSSCADSTTVSRSSKHNVRRELHRVNASCEFTTDFPRSEYEKTKSGRTFKRGHEHPKENVTNLHKKDERTTEASHCRNGAQEASKTDQITRLVNESRQRRESTETSRDKIAVTVEERQQLEEVVASETHRGTRFKKLQKESRQLTIKNKEKCISLKKEKSHSEEYIIRNNEQATLQHSRGSHLPKDSPSNRPEETERLEVSIAQTELAVSLATRHCQDAEEYRATAGRSKGGNQLQHQSKKVKRKDEEPLSLSEELRNAGWSPEPHLNLLRNTLCGVPSLRGNNAGEDLLKSARLREETFKGHYDRYKGEEFQNVNTSANPSSVVDLCEHEFPAGFLNKNIHAAKAGDFFEQRNSGDFCKDELIMQGSYFSFNEGKDEIEGSLNGAAGKWNIRSESNNETNFVTGSESACVFNITCADKQFSKSENNEAPESVSLLLHPPTQWDVHNINNSGNDESQSSYSPTSRGKKNMFRNSRQNKIDKLGWTRGEPVGVAGDQNPKEETKLRETKALLKSFPRIKNTVLRKRRSFGRSYLSRLLARHIGSSCEQASDCDCNQNPSCQTYNENYTGNSNHRALRKDAVPCGAEGGGDIEEIASNDQTSKFSESKLQGINSRRPKCVVYHKDQSRGKCPCAEDVPDALLLQSQRRFSNLQVRFENTAAVSPSCYLSSFPHDESQSNDSADSTYEPGEILNCSSTGSCNCLAPSKHSAEIPVGPFLHEHNTQDAEISLLCEECEKWNLDQVADGHEEGEENTHSFHTIEDEATDEGAQADSEVEATGHFHSGQDVAANIPTNSYFMSPADSGHFHHTNSASPPGTTATSSSRETALSSSHSIAVEPTDNNNGAIAISDSMMQAYGYNPMTESPFTARGYPELQQDVTSLDHINVPFVKRKALAFLRDEKDEFVEVGRGTYGCVYLAQAATRRGTTKVVVKDFFTDSTSWDLIVHEARMLCYLQDTGVIPHFYGLLKRRSSADDFSLIQQYFGHGKTLHTVIVNKEPLQPLVWQDIAWQLARGLLLIHDRHVLLNDLKGDNVLIDLRRERKVIKYIDVGMATFRKGLNFHLPKDQMSKFNFLAPEVRAGAFTSPMSDMFSLGYLLDQINRLARLELLRYLSMGCMESVPVERLHLPDVVDALELHSKALTGACYAASAGGEPSFKAASASQMDKKLKSLLV